MKILIAANSPGEVAWIRPLAYRAHDMGLSLDVLLYPCSFATGQEAKVLASFPAVERIYSPGQCCRLLASSPYPRGTPLLHLGGDLMYTAALQARWQWRCYSYLWARPWWNFAFRGFFSRNSQSTRGLLKRRVDSAKIFEVGDLVVDALAQAVPEVPRTDPHRITLLPGSRLREVVHLLPFMLRVAELLKAENHAYQFQVNLSPFLNLAEVERGLKQPLDPRLGGSPSRLLAPDLVASADLQVPVHRQQGWSHLAGSGLVLTIPGTKTAEAGALGVPCLTLVPLNCPEMLPVGGLLGLLDWLPGGAALKGAWMLRQRSRMGLLAQPNQLLGQALLPEMLDRLTPEAVAQQAQGLLSQPELLQQKGLQLRQAYGELAGASQRMLKLLLADL